MRINHQKTSRYVIDAQKGSGEAFAELYKLYFSPLHFFLLRQLDDENSALEAIQETFLHALVHLDTLKNPQAFHKWIYSIAAARAADIKRRLVRERSTWAPLPEDEADDATTMLSDESEEFLPESVLATQESRERVQKAIAHLTDAQREVVILHYFAEFSPTEIAEILELQPVTVRKRLHDARAALVTQLEPKQKAGAWTVAKAPKHPVLADILSGDAKNVSVMTAQASVAANLGMVLPLMLKSATLGPEVSSRVGMFAQLANAHKLMPSPAPAAPATAPAAMPLAAKIAIGLAAAALVAGGGVALTKYYAARPQAATAENIAQHTGARKTEPTKPGNGASAEATATTTAAAQQSAPATDQPQPQQQQQPQQQTTPAPAPEPQRPTITIAYPQLSYPVGAQPSAATILADCGAAASDSAGTAIPVQLSGYDDIDFSAPGTTPVSVMAHDSAGTGAYTKVVLITIGG